MKPSSIVVGAFLVLLAVGCGNRKPSVNGSVTFAGRPIEKGSIAFFPATGKGQTASSAIRNGRFHLEASPGLMKVVIQAPQVVGQRNAYDDEPDGPKIDVVREILPGRYSDMHKSELTYTVQPGSNEAKFELLADERR